MLLNIKREIEQHHNKKFSSEKEEYQDNYEGKKKLIDYTIELFKNKQLNKDILKDILNIFSKNTGSSEDLEILDVLFSDLLDNQIINNEEYQNVIESSSVARWGL